MWIAGRTPRRTPRLSAARWTRGLALVALLAGLAVAPGCQSGAPVDSGGSDDRVVSGGPSEDAGETDRSATDTRSGAGEDGAGDRGTGDASDSADAATRAAQDRDRDVTVEDTLDRGATSEPEFEYDETLDPTVPATPDNTAEGSADSQPADTTDTGAADDSSGTPATPNAAEALEPADSEYAATDVPHPTDNPVVARIDDNPIVASQVVRRLFERHNDWYQHFLRNLYVSAFARHEAEREGIDFSEAEIEAGFELLVALLQRRARVESQSWRLYWQSLGYETEADYLEDVRAQVERLLRLDHLVALLDLRKTKVGYSRISIPDQADSFVPDPRGLATEVADKIRAGELGWNAAVREYSSDFSRLSSNGAAGAVHRNVLGVPTMDEFLFSAEPGDISEPILHPVNGWMILRVDQVQPGNPDLSYAEAEERVWARYENIPPGAQTTPQMTFYWLDEVLRSNRYQYEVYRPISTEHPWIAVIDEQPITAGDLLRFAVNSNPDWIQQTVTEAIVFRVARHEARREGMQIEAERVEAAAQATLGFLKRSTAERGESFEAMWRSQGFVSEAQFRDRVLRAYAEEAMLVDRLIRLHDRRVEQREVWQIVVHNREIAAVALRALNNGADFASVARRYSDDAASREAGGRVGMVPRDRFAKAWTDAVFGLPLNTISEPFETSLGWHIARVTDTVPARPDLSWRQARPEIEAAIRAEAGGTTDATTPGNALPYADLTRWIRSIVDSRRYDIRTGFRTPGLADTDAMLTPSDPVESDDGGAN